MFKEMANLAGMLKSAGEMRRKMEAIGAELQSKRVHGAAADGRLEVTANGLGEVLNVRIAPDLLQPGECERLESSLPIAINEALRKAKELHLQLAQSATDGLSLPGMEDLLSKMMPK